MVPRVRGTGVCNMKDAIYLTIIDGTDRHNVIEALELAGFDITFSRSTHDHVKGANKFEYLIENEATNK